MREIDEAVRKDDVEQFAKKYGVAIAGLLAIVLVGFGGYLFWDSRNEAALEAESETIVSALDSTQAGEFDAAAKKVDPLLDSGSPGARTSARFLKAGAALEQGKFDEAVALYKQVADDPDAPPALRDLARIREVATNFDTRKPADVIAKLKDLAVPGNAFFGSAGELTAIAHLESGNRREAGAMFAAIAKDEDVPNTLRTRARQMAGLLGVDAIEDVEQLLEDEGVLPADRDGEGPIAAQ
ncbi:tetratricopeptide repeat protein [Erythrobacter sp. JK5]|nr:tetratricopeptide repeat protein [Erythrobacter sp. JK5]